MTVSNTFTETVCSTAQYPRQTPPFPRSPPPTTTITSHDHSPPHHCAYPSRPIVHCTPLAHAADRWRSVCTMTDAPAQSHLRLRHSHVRTPTSVWRRRSGSDFAVPTHPHTHTPTPPPHHCAYNTKTCYSLHASRAHRRTMEISVHDDGRAGTKSPPPLARTSRSPCHAPVWATVRTPQKLSITLRLSRTVDVPFALGWHTNSPIAYVSHPWSPMCIRRWRGGCSLCG